MDLVKALGTWESVSFLSSLAGVMGVAPIIQRTNHHDINAYVLDVKNL